MNEKIWTNLTQLRERARAAEDEYNPEDDLIPDAPKITAADNDLLDMVIRLATICEDQQREIEDLKATIKTEVRLLEKKIWISQ